MSAVVFVGTDVPDKSLVKTHKFKAYLSDGQKKDIISQIKEKIPNLENYIITMHVEIDLKLYDTKNTRIRGQEG